MVKNIVIALVILAAIGGLVYKAVSPNDYQHPATR